MGSLHTTKMTDKLKMCTSLHRFPKECLTCSGCASGMVAYQSSGRVLTRHYLRRSWPDETMEDMFNTGGRQGSWILAGETPVCFLFCAAPFNAPTLYTNGAPSMLSIACRKIPCQPTERIPDQSRKGCAWRRVDCHRESRMR